MESVLFSVPISPPQKTLIGQQYIEICTPPQSGDSKENSESERVNSTIKNELLMGKVFHNIDEADSAISKAIATYNTVRPHMSIDYMTPQEARECTGPLKKRWRSYREDAIQKARKDKESKELVTS
ncbi:integrase core domain-containing protein [Porphyromonas sp.]|uniref:integrase core domain-containing protein n=1 Tax=Porphyromonas sp. TaxID=1924944 RepID=UPI003A94C348